MTLHNITQWARHNSLWLVGFGLMLASSGLDGAYMSQWMAHDWRALGYILNTMSDITGMVLTYWYGIFQQSASVERARAQRFLLAAEAVAIAYSWLFSWRQLRFVMPGIEISPLTSSAWEVELVAFVSAGFIPLTLAVVGYAQAMQVHAHDVRIGITHKRPKEDGSAQSKTQDKIVCPYCGADQTQDGKPLASLSAHLRWCDAYQAQKEEE